METSKALWKSILLGVAVGAGMLILLSLISAVLVNNGTLPEAGIPLCGVVVNALSVFGGCCVALRRQGGKTLIVSLSTGLGLLGCMLLVRAAVAEEWSSYTVQSALVSALLALGCAFLPSKGRRRRKIR